MHYLALLKKHNANNLTIYYNEITEERRIDMQDKNRPEPKNSKGSIRASIDSNPCGRCRTAGYPTCKCGSGGGGSGGGGGGESEKKDATYTSNQAPGISNQVEVKAAIQKFDEAKTIFVQSQLLSNTTVNYETGLITIESDRLRGNLTLRVKPGLSKADEEISHEFLNAVKTEFDEFKNKLFEQGVSTKDFTATLKGNELSVHIPNPKYYDAFIKHLENKNLLPVPNPEREEKKETLSSAKEDKKQAFNPTPLSTRLEKK